MCKSIEKEGTATKMAISYFNIMSQPQWYTPRILALGRLKQKAFKFKADLAMQQDLVSKKRKRKKPKPRSYL